MENHTTLMCRQNKNSELVLSIRQTGQNEQTIGVCGLVARINKFGKRSNSVKLYALMRRAIEKGCRDIEFDRLPGTKAFGPAGAEQYMLTLFNEFMQEAGHISSQVEVQMATVDRSKLTKLVCYKGVVARIPASMDIETYKRQFGRKKSVSGSMKDTGIFPK